jgi:hypothetical protein
VNAVNQWGPAVLVTLAVAIGILFNNARISDLRQHVDGRIDDLKDFVRAEIRRLEDRITRIEDRIARMESPIQRP